MEENNFNNGVKNFNPPPGYDFKKPENNVPIREKAKKELSESMGAINEAFGFMSDKLGEPVFNAVQRETMGQPQRPQTRMPQQQINRPKAQPTPVPVIDTAKMTKEQYDQSLEPAPEQPWSQDGGEGAIDPKLEAYVQKRIAEIRKQNPEAAQSIQNPPAEEFEQKRAPNNPNPSFKIQQPQQQPSAGNEERGMEQPNKPRYSYQVDPKHHEHPVLTRLKQKFGLKQIPTYTFDVKDVAGDLGKFKIRALSDEMGAWTTRAAEFTSAGSEENLVKFRLAIAAASVVEVDGAAIFEVMQTNPTEYCTSEELLKMKKDISYLPPVLHKEAARRLFMLFLHEFPGLGQKVYEAYEEEIDPKTVLRSSVDEKNKLKLRWKCPVEGCDIEYFEIPTPTEHGFMPKYCKNHSVEMPIISDSETEGNIPLA